MNGYLLVFYMNHTFYHKLILPLAILAVLAFGYGWWSWQVNQLKQLEQGSSSTATKQGAVENNDETFDVQRETDMESEVDTSDWQTYRNEEYGFSFEYPTDYVTFDVGLESTTKEEFERFMSSYVKAFTSSGGETKLFVYNYDQEKIAEKLEDATILQKRTEEGVAYQLITLDYGYNAIFAHPSLPKQFIMLNIQVPMASKPAVDEALLIATTFKFLE